MKRKIPHVKITEQVSKKQKVEEKAPQIEEKQKVLPVRKSTRRKMKARKGMSSSKFIQEEEEEGDNTKFPEDVRPFVKVILEENVQMDVAALDVEPISTKYKIVDFNSKETRQESYIIIRQNGEKRVYSNVDDLMEDIDRTDVMDLYNILEERRKKETLTGYELLLWGDLRNMFVPDADSEAWKNQDK